MSTWDRSKLELSGYPVVVNERWQNSQEGALRVDARQPPSQGFLLGAEKVHLFHEAQLAKVDVP
jgi:hypothetical protein